LKDPPPPPPQLPRWPWQRYVSCCHLVLLVASIVRGAAAIVSGAFVWGVLAAGQKNQPQCFILRAAGTRSRYGVTPSGTTGHSAPLPVVKPRPAS